MIATAPASVAVKIPRRIPPMMIIGRHSGRIAGFAALPNSFGEIFYVRMGT